MAIAGLIGGVAGAIGGGLIGGQTGAQIGFLVGSLLATALFPDTLKGPRLEDLRTTTSAYGQNIALIFGAGRKAGNVIWSENKEERSKTRRQGIFGPKVKEYSYFLTCAISFCEGPMADVLRIWANGDLVYDKREDNQTNRLKGLVFKFYPGSATQGVDPVIDASRITDGAVAGTTPAYRDQCYIVFTRFPLAEYNNEMPNIEVELSETVDEVEPGTIVDEATVLAGTLTTANNLIFAVDWLRQFAYAIDTSPFGDPTLTGIRRVNLVTMEEDRQRLSEDAFDQVDSSQSPADVVARQPACVMPLTGRVVVQLETSVGTNAEPFAVLDPNSLREMGRCGIESSNLDYRLTGSDPSWGLSAQCAGLALHGPDGPQEYALMRASGAASFGLMYIARDGSPNFAYHNDDTLFDSIRSVCGGQVATGFGYGYVTTGNAYTLASSDPLVLYRVRVRYIPETEFLSAITTSAPAALLTTMTNIQGSGFLKIIRSFDPGDLIPGETALRNAGRALVYDSVDNTAMFHVQADSDGAHYLVKVDRDGDVVWRTEIPGLPDASNTWNQSRVENDAYGFLSAAGNGTLIDTATGEILVDNVSFPVGVATGALGAYDSRTDSWVGLTGDTSTVWARYWFRLVNTLPTTVAAAVTRIAARVGLEASDIDVTDLVDDDLLGYIIASQTSARDAIAPLALAYFFDGVESDFLMKFVQRGAAVARTISTEDMLRTSDGNIVMEARTQDVELPQRLSVTYMNQFRDYEVDTHQARRIIEPSPTVHGQNQSDIQIPIVSRATFMKQVAEKAMYAAWIERRNYAKGLPWTHLDLDPTDVVAVTTETETIARMRLLTMDVSSYFEIEATSLREEEGQYEGFNEGDDGEYPDSPVGATIVRLLLIDSPLLNDVDEQPGRTGAPLYFMMGGYGLAGWDAATLYKTQDSGVVSYDVAGRVTEEMTWGSSLNALGDPASPHATDEDNDLTVQITAGDGVFASITQLAMLSGGNRAALLKDDGGVEIIHFRDVVDNGGGSYTLSGLLRGRRGTDTMCYDHTIGETFVLLPDDEDEEYTDYVPIALSELDAERYYKGVGDRQFFEDAEVVPFTSEGRALMPYAPVNIHALLNVSDIDITWFRRNRLDAEINLEDLGGDILLSEDAEEYEVEITATDQGPISPARLFSGLTTPDVTYTAAQQATDGFTAPVASVTLLVYQVSGQAGRGFARETTFDVEV